MPVEIIVKKPRDSHKYVIGRVNPGHYAVIEDYSTGRPKNITVHVSPDNSTATVYEFPNGLYKTFLRPDIKEIPLRYYSKSNLDKTLQPGQKFEHSLLTKSSKKGRLVFTHY